jgi:hypothetical protein
MYTHCLKTHLPRSFLSVLFSHGKRLNFIAIRKKTSSVGITYQWGEILQPWLPYKTISITYFVCVFVTLGIQHAMRMRRIVLPYVTWPAVQDFSTLAHKWHEFRKKNMFWFIVQLLSEIFSCHKKKWARYYHKCLLVFTLNIRYSCHILMKLEFSWLVLDEYSNIRFHENPPNGSRFVPCGQTDRETEGQTDMTKLKDVFRNFERV